MSVAPYTVRYVHPACRSPRTLYVTSTQLNKIQNNCSISHKTPQCRPKVTIRSTILALLHAFRGRECTNSKQPLRTTPTRTGSCRQTDKNQVQMKKWSVVFILGGGTHNFKAQMSCFTQCLWFIYSWALLEPQDLGVRCVTTHSHTRRERVTPLDHTTIQSLAAEMFLEAKRNSSSCILSYLLRACDKRHFGLGSTTKGNSE